MGGRKKSREENKRKYFNRIYGKGTGRIISEPTLQDLHRSPLAPKGTEHILVTRDFHTMELRVIANMSEADFKKYMKGVP
jgi:hypothetical protein